MPIQKGPGHGENSEPLNFGIEKKGGIPWGLRTKPQIAAGSTANAISR